MVVEHDLTLLDFLSDYIEVLYGEPAAYGIVSSVLSTKVGINVFLDGYLPTENIRFRDKKFSFDASSSSTDVFQEGSDVITYPKLEKKYPSFSVTIEPGRVRVRPNPIPNLEVKPDVAVVLLRCESSWEATVLAFSIFQSIF